MPFLTRIQTINHGLIARIFSSTPKFFLEGKKLTISQRGVRLGVSLVQPVLSLTGLLDNYWEVGFEVVSIFMVVTSFTGVCFAGKIWNSFRGLIQKVHV
jgi:hypothetical protein